VYGTSDKIGSAGTMYDLLQVASDLDPIHGNKDGQLVTMASDGGLLFGYFKYVVYINANLTAFKYCVSTE
jgi:hypothetical protein